MTKTGFGEHLKREREMRGVSLDEICSATRIGTRFLQALEDEEWDRLPGGVFNRGFVRGVSRYLGLDEEGMVAEYVTAVNEGKDTTPGWAAKPEPQKAAIDWRPWVGAAAVLVLLIAAGWFGWRFHSARRAQRSAALAAAQLAIPSPADAAAAQTSASSTAVAGGSPAGPGDGSAPAVAAPAPADMLLLKIEAGKATSVTVAADGSTAFDGNMIAGQSRSFQAQNELDVSAQDAGALLLELNGQTLAPMGPPGHPGKVTLTRSNLKGSAGGAD
jgi:cytoskeletal protein RodZ